MENHQSQRKAVTEEERNKGTTKQPENNNMALVNFTYQ